MFENCNHNTTMNKYNKKEDKTNHSDVYSGPDFYLLNKVYMILIDLEITGKIREYA